MTKRSETIIPTTPSSLKARHSQLIAWFVLIGGLVLIFGVVRGVDTYLQKFLAPPVDVSDRRIATDDEVLRGYLATHGPDKAIALLKAIPGVDCHQRVHKVGRLSYEISNKDAFKVLNSECMSGYTHGVTEAFFREHGTQNLSESLKLICQGEQNSFYSHQCYHGIGHGLIAYNDYDLPVALRECDTLPDEGTNHESCYSGVFMENVVGAIAINDEVPVGGTVSDFHYSKYLSDDPHYPCTAVESQYRSSCYFFQSSRMIEIFGADFEKLANTCAGAESIYHIVCFMSMGRDVDSIYNTNFKSIEKSCFYAPSEDLALACISGAAQDRFWHISEQDDALALCRALRTSAKSRCYSELASRAPDIMPSQEDQQEFCGKYEEDYKQLCSSLL